MKRNSSSLPVGSFIRSYPKTRTSESQLTVSEIKQENPDIQIPDDESSGSLKTREIKMNRIEDAKIETTSSIGPGVESLKKETKKEPFKRRREWSETQTLKFYKALSACGTDFQMMETMFDDRTRSQLKAKFKREDRHNAEQVSRALQKQVFDPNFPLTDSQEEKKPDLQALSTNLKGNGSKRGRKKTL